MRAPILVTGGTGTLGRLVVARLRNAGMLDRVLNRSGPVTRRTSEDFLAERVGSRIDSVAVPA